jgi:hypothetical protein
VEPLFFDFNLFQQFAGGRVVCVLGNEAAHDGELEDGLAQFDDVFLDGVEFAEVFLNKVPGANRSAVTPAPTNVIPAATNVIPA